ncbi:MAG: two-component system sensor histidine kinase NtrB [Desulfomonilaceae bacterium]
MKKDRNFLTNDDDGQKTWPANALKVLIVGDSEKVDDSKELLDSLTMIGYHIARLGAVTRSASKITCQKEMHSGNSLLEEVKKRLNTEPPDILILTTDDQELSNSMMGLIQPQTRFLDPFVLKIIKGLKDVSGQLASTRTRLQSVELMKEVLMSGSETSIMVVNEDFKIVEINNAILERTNKSQEDCIGRLCHWVVRKDMKPCYIRGEKCLVQEVLQTGRAGHTVREERRSDGTVRYFSISSYPLPKDEQGKKNIIIVWKDISKQMTPVLNRQARSIRQSFTHTLQQDKMAALGKLASAAVHEINNPIQGILTFAKLMRRSFDKKSLSEAEMERFSSYLDLISVESDRCGKILQGLLAFSRKRDINKSVVDLTKTFQDIALLMGNRMKLQGISLCIEKHCIMPVVYCDGDLMKQALLNLVLNSVEAMPNGGLIVISVDLPRDAKHLIISIQDTGSGIPKNVQRNIFDPFFTTKKDGKGTGLGLSIVYGIMLQHEGTIGVESAEGEGTTFVVTLPIGKESLAQSAEKIGQ